MAIHRVAIENVRETLGKEIQIPPYQRPYKWDGRLVGQLIHDLLRHQGKSAYRLGTLVLHRNPDTGKLEVVDGQQRLVTLALLLHLLGEKPTPQLLQQPIAHPLSRQNIRDNALIIRQHLESLPQDAKDGLRRFLTERCEWVVLELEDISEAFQFFDAQNSRGKDLEPYDLLKAYHLREMDDVPESVRTKCVEAWEREVENGVLKPIMHEVLFPIRCWLRGRSGREFRKADIDVFKGVRLARAEAYPFLQSNRICDLFTHQYAQDPVRQVDRHPAVFPFQLGQIMIDGQRFFEFVHHYIAVRRLLERRTERTQEIQKLYEVLDSYEGHGRTGDQYTRRLFECVVLCYYDRFATHGLDKATQMAFAWAYAMRLEQHTVKLATMDGKALETGNLFQVIQNAMQPWDVANASIPRISKQKVSEVSNSAKTSKIQNLLATMGYMEP